MTGLQELMIRKQFLFPSASARTQVFDLMDIKRTFTEIAMDTKRTFTEIAMDTKRTFTEIAMDTKRTFTEIAMDTKRTFTEIAMDTKRTFTEIAMDTKRTFTEIAMDTRYSFPAVMQDINEPRNSEFVREKRNEDKIVKKKRVTVSEKVPLTKHTLNPHFKSAFEILRVSKIGKQKIHQFAVFDMPSKNEMLLRHRNYAGILRNNSQEKTVKKTLEYIHYETSNRFVLEHIQEVNNCCAGGSFTAAFIVCRKLFENLIVQDVILKKYPGVEGTEIYFNVSKGRARSFSYILQNLHSKKNDFGPNEQLLVILLDKLQMFKDEANSAAHNSHHLVRDLKELDIVKIQDILTMIADLRQRLVQQG